MASPDPFAQLPAEIRAAVLGGLKPADLYSSICASPSLLFAFTECRREVLSQAVRNAIHPQVMNDALGLLYCPRFETGDGHFAKVPLGPGFEGTFLEHRRRREGRIRKWEVKVAAFLKTHQGQGHRFPTDIKALSTLLQLERLVGAFIDDFVMTVGRASGPRFVDTLSTKYTPGEQAPCEPSIDEHIRLQRAFFRYELQSRIWCLAGMEVKLDTNGFGHLRTVVRNIYALIRSFPPSEREELMCVCQYIKSQYGMAWRKFEEAFEHAVKAKAMPDSASAHHPPVGQLLSLELHPYFLEEESGYIDSIAAYGLGFLKWFQQPEPEFRHAFIRLTYGHGLMASCFGINDMASSPNWRRKGIVRGPGGSNELWKAIRKDRAIWDLVEESPESLREMGWAVWDRDRLVSMNLWTKTQINLALNFSYYKGWNLYNKPVRWWECRVSSQDWKPIAEEFQITLPPDNAEEQLAARSFVISLVKKTRIELI